ncbi:NagB 6-phosphogluconolactonase/Glucosamine-6-phosphate isomerase/deaminase [Candidatus Nanopelagicaceae bacterium]
MSDEFDEIVGDIDGELDLTLYADGDELADEVTAQILIAIENGLLAQGVFHLVLTGGTLGVQIANSLKSAFNAAPEMYKGLHIWWSDERFVNLDSSERNAAPFHGTLTNTNIQIHESLAPDSPATIEDAVENYRGALEGVTVDLNILGVGPDGHVASLFPGIADLDDLRNIFAITDSPKPPAMRISFTMKFINEAREIWIVAAGESKADAVAKIIEGDLSIPASYVSAQVRTRLIVDQASFFSE